MCCLWAVGNTGLTKKKSAGARAVESKSHSSEDVCNGYLCWPPFFVSTTGQTILAPQRGTSEGSSTVLFSHVYEDIAVAGSTSMATATRTPPWTLEVSASLQTWNPWTWMKYWTFSGSMAELNFVSYWWVIKGSTNYHSDMKRDSHLPVMLARLSELGGPQLESFKKSIVNNLVVQRKGLLVSGVREENVEIVQLPDHLKKSIRKKGWTEELGFATKNGQECQESLYVRRLQERMKRQTWTPLRASSLLPAEPVNSQSVLGAIKWFNGKRGYGFIMCHDSGEDIFVHRSVVHPTQSQEFRGKLDKRYPFWISRYIWQGLQSNQCATTIQRSSPAKFVLSQESSRVFQVIPSARSASIGRLHPKSIWPWWHEHRNTTSLHCIRLVFPVLQLLRRVPGHSATKSTKRIEEPREDRQNIFTTTTFKDDVTGFESRHETLLLHSAKKNRRELLHSHEICQPTTQCRKESSTETVWQGGDEPNQAIYGSKPYGSVGAPRYISAKVSITG